MNGVNEKMAFTSTTGAEWEYVDGHLWWRVAGASSGIQVTSNVRDWLVRLLEQPPEVGKVVPLRRGELHLDLSHSADGVRIAQWMPNNVGRSLSPPLSAEDRASLSGLLREGQPFAHSSITKSLVDRIRRRSRSQPGGLSP